MLADLEYVRRQLALIKSHIRQPPVVADCAQRATDAIERAIEEATRKERDLERAEAALSQAAGRNVKFW